jgi:hypothetical protein
VPVVPHYPTDEPDRDEEAPDLTEIIEGILGDDDRPSPVPA